MRKIIILFVSLFSLLTGIEAQEKLTINTENSTIRWIGEYTFHFGGHDGYIQFKEGFFIKKGNKITGGEFVIDMNSMTNNDIKEQEGKDSLINHLKDPDFFDVPKYPIAKLEILTIEYFKNNKGKIHANMTIKEITKPITFNAEFNYDKKEMFARFKIDRRDWNVSYKSKFKNGAISDAIGFEVTINL
ncbi:YceI family protein [Tenacibaculum jejuense]|uniref:YCE I like family protein n=1 Tax=Tenacibaculum jejuense TaxID=584609 RepID=A0A238U4K6_9FLAO|nr:YceI family protein [Tenacibaculum jejuense]SNR14032.1 YCE I like family protein [Tenacibaculum jejuense]